MPLNWEKLIYLDSKGLLPKADENEASFRKRADMMFVYLNDPKLRAKILEDIVKNHEPGTGISMKSLSPDSSHPVAEKFHGGVKRFCAITKSDISWTPVLTYKLGRNSRLVSGQSNAFIYSLKSEPIFSVPYMLVSRGPEYTPFSTGIHESFHSIRRPLFSGGIFSRAAYDFDHLGELLDRPVRRWLINPFDRFIEQTPLRIQFQFLEFYRHLNRTFGDTCWYVLVRLSYNELYYNFYEEKRDPVEFLRYAAGQKENLRHQIICHKLGL